MSPPGILPHCDSAVLLRSLRATEPRHATPLILPYPHNDPLKASINCAVGHPDVKPYQRWAGARLPEIRVIGVEATLVSQPCISYGWIGRDLAELEFDGQQLLRVLLRQGNISRLVPF